MRVSATLTTTALAAAAALLLTACGSDAKPSDTIKGVQTGAPPSPSPSIADAAHRPKITLPADVHDVFENTSTGDPVKDAIWSDTAQFVMALDEARAEGNPNLPALLYYTREAAAGAVARSVERYRDHGVTITGTDRYYAPEITVHNKTTSLTYCSDESEEGSRTTLLASSASRRELPTARSPSLPWIPTTPPPRSRPRAYARSSPTIPEMTSGGSTYRAGQPFPASACAK